MENFKEIAEKCLAGELSGTFVFQNGQKISSSKLRKFSEDSMHDDYIYSFKGVCTLDQHGFGYNASYNIINFIPDNMQKQIKIDIPEGKVPIVEQSEKGVIITWKEHELTYTELLNEFRNNLNCIHVNLINSSSQAFYKKVEILRKLTNIRNYFGKPEGNENGFYINLLGQAVTNGFPAKYASDRVVFAEKEHAEQAIKMLGDELKYLFEPW